MNTAIEQVVDDIGMERRDLAKQAKDAGNNGWPSRHGAAWATISCMNFCKSGAVDGARTRDPGVTGRCSGNRLQPRKLWDMCFHMERQ